MDLWLAVAKDDGEAHAFSINKISHGFCDYQTMGVNPYAPKSTYPLYGLVFEMNKYYLKDCGLRYVLDGSRSITAHSNIQPFLVDKFKFRRAYCDLQLFYKPWLGIAVKIAFPFRKWLNNSKVAALLRQEAWSRGFEK